jgi:hypothetical protein
MGRAGAGSSLLQEMHEGPAVREQLHQCQREVQAAAGVRVLTAPKCEGRSCELLT